MAALIVSAVFWALATSIACILSGYGLASTALGYVIGGNLGLLIGAAINVFRRD